MPARTSYVLSTPGFVVDPESVQLNSGRQVNWDGVASDGTYGTTGSRSLPAGTMVGEVGGQLVARTDRKNVAIVLDGGGNGTVTENAHGRSVGDRVTIEGSANADIDDQSFVIASITDANTYVLTVPAAVGAAASENVTVAATALGIMVASAQEDSKSDSLSGYGVYVGGVFYETMLPDAGDAALALLKTELNTYGNGFLFESYQDVRA